MNGNLRKKLNNSIRRTFSLLLAALMTSSSVLASSPRPIINIGNIGGGLNVLDYEEKIDGTKEREKELKELYGEDWQEVGALQPGDSYISGDTMYVCHKETYVDWKRVKTANDLDTASWDGEDRLLLLTDATGKRLYLGNDYANSLERIQTYHNFNMVVLNASHPSDTRQVISNVITDTSKNNADKYVEEFVYPELNEFYQNKKGGYPYPDTFQTVGTMNAPYIRDAGLDSTNDDQRMFKIILSKDDGSISGVGLDRNEDAMHLGLRAVNECDGFTFHMEGGNLKIFNYNDFIDWAFYLQLIENRRDGADSNAWRLASMVYQNPKDMSANQLVAYVGEKTVDKRIEVISLALEDAEQNPEALENVYGGAIEFYHWEKITKSSQLPTGGDTYRALLVWDDSYFLQGDDFRKHSNEDGMALYVNEEKKSGAAPGNVAEVPEINLSHNEFYTMGGLGTPYIRFKGHKDKNEDNDACPYYRFQLAGMDDQPSEKWLCDGDNELDLCVGEIATERYGGMDVGIIVGQEAESDNNADPGKVKLFFNDGGGYDTGFYHSGNVLYGEDDMWGWDYGQFTLYIGKPVAYPAVRQNYVVGEDQFMHISQNGAMLKNVTISVEKGGVLSIESWFMNNGRIVVNGGTLIVQNASNPLGDEEADDTEDSVVMPFADINPTVSGSLDLRNGGELIVLDDARAAFGKVTAAGGSSILNSGMLLAETVTLKESTLENRPGKTMFAGYYFRPMGVFRNGSVSEITNGLATRLNESVPCITMDAKSTVENNGTIKYSTWRSTDTSVVSGEIGKGEYNLVRGKKA